jgi:hypothetical protein
MPQGARRKRAHPIAAAGLSEQRQAYYSVLQEDPQFLADLHDLFNRVFPVYARERKARERGRAIELRVTSTTPAQQTEVDRFAKKWHLPTAYTWELEMGLTVAADPALPIGLYAVADKYLIFDRSLIRITVECKYDPEDPSPSQVWHYTRIFRARLVEEINRRRTEALMRAGGSTPPRLRDRLSLTRLARRLYRRAVRGWSWKRIATEDGISEAAAKRSVLEWATRLRVPLPEIPAGRPKERK